PGAGSAASLTPTAIDTGIIRLSGGQIAVTLGDTAPIAGGVVSRTVTVKPFVALLPCASVEEHVTGLVPSPNVDPDDGRHVTAGDPSTRSVADAVKVATAPDDEVASITMFAGTVTIGGVVSRTAIVNELDAELPCASVAEHVTVVERTPNVEPDAGRHVAAGHP